MDNQPLNMNPNPPVITNITTPPQKSVGPTVGLVIVLILIILGGIYFWMKQSDYKETAWTETNKDTDTQAFEQQSSSDEISSIEADLDSTDFNNLDQGYSEINAELQ